MNMNAKLFVIWKPEVFSVKSMTRHYEINKFRENISLPLWYNPVILLNSNLESLSPAETDKVGSSGYFLHSEFSCLNFSVLLKKTLHDVSLCLCLGLNILFFLDYDNLMFGVHIVYIHNYLFYNVLFISNIFSNS